MKNSKKINSKKETKKTNNVQNKSYKRGSLITTIYKLFSKKGIDNISYEECLELAKSIKPNTKFNKFHFSWYKNQFNNFDSEQLAKYKN